MDEGVCNGGITVDRVLMSPVEPHIKCVTVLAQVPLKGRVINPDEHCLLMVLVMLQDSLSAIEKLFHFLE